MSGALTKRSKSKNLPLVIAERIDVEVDGEKRQVRAGIPLGLSLFEMKDD